MSAASSGVPPQTCSRRDRASSSSFDKSGLVGDGEFAGDHNRGIEVRDALKVVFPSSPRSGSIPLTSAGCPASRRRSRLGPPALQREAPAVREPCGHHRQLVEVGVPSRSIRDLSVGISDGDPPWPRSAVPRNQPTGDTQGGKRGKPGRIVLNNGGNGDKRRSFGPEQARPTPGN